MHPMPRGAELPAISRHRLTLTNRDQADVSGNAVTACENILRIGNRMNYVRVYTPGNLPAADRSPLVAAMPSRAPADVIIETVDAVHLAGIESAWRDLLDRADARNVFMDPALVR